MDWPTGIDKIQAAIHERFVANDWWHYRGETVKKFEQKFAEFHGRKFGVAVCNGTVPLQIILEALGIRPGDKILVPAFDFYSLPKSISDTGATPVFCDVIQDNLTIDTVMVKARLKTGDIRAVVGVHISSAVPE